MADDRGANGDDGVIGLLDELAGELRSEIASGLDELRAAFAELRESAEDGGGGGSRAATSSPSAGVDLDAMAQALGVSRKQLEQSIGAARSAERRDEIKPILQSLLEEMGLKPAAADDDGGDGESETKPKAKPRSRAQAAPAGSGNDDGDDGEPGSGDSNPAKPHWSEGAIGNLVR